MTQDEAQNGVRILRAEFERPAESITLLPPPSIPEIAFVGRSNVGKSSLLNALCNRKSLARTSKTPGRTQALNFFRIEFSPGKTKADPDGGSYKFDCYFVDLPGFGYAQVSKKMKRAWHDLIGRYLLERTSLAAVLLLIDSRRTPGEEELWLAKQGRSGGLWVALTKCDKLTKNDFKKVQGETAKALRLPAERIVPVSVHDKKYGDVAVLRTKLLEGLVER